MIGHVHIHAVQQAKQPWWEGTPAPLLLLLLLLQLVLLADMRQWGSGAVKQLTTARRWVAGAEGTLGSLVGTCRWRRGARSLQRGYCGGRGPTRASSGMHGALRAALHARWASWVTSQDPTKSS